MAIKVIIVIKITTVIMKKTIVLKLMKIVVQSHNPKTYTCSNSDNVQQEFLNLSPNAHSKGTKNRDLRSLSSILRPKGAIVVRILL